jgi:hypothetical protein
MANQYRIANYLISAQDEGFEELLATIHNTAYRPLCLCKGEPGIPMYVSHVGEHFIIKRMPDSGNQHAPDCNSFEPPCELSGLGDVLGSAIQCNEEDGTTSLKFDFSLSKTTGRTPTPGSGGEASSVRTDGKRLTLRGTLHYLWEEAGFNRWFPAMAGKRNWYTIHQHLLLAAEGKLSKGKPLSDTLFVPQPFFVDRKAEIAHRRWERLTKVAAADKGPRDLMLLIAEDSEPWRTSFRRDGEHRSEVMANGIPT